MESHRYSKYLKYLLSNIPLSIAIFVVATLAIAGGGVVGNFKITGEVNAGSAVVDNLTLNANSIITTDTNGDLLLTPDGTGDVIISSGTANRAMILDASKQLVSSSVTDTELTLLSGVSALFTASSVDVTTNKSMDGDDNTFTDIGITSLKTEAGSPDVFVSRNGSGVIIDTKVVPAGTVLGDTDVATVTNKSLNSDNNTITNIVNADIKALAAIARSKIASGTNDHVVINGGAGALSSEAQLAISRGGTGQATAVPAFDALAPTTTKADIVVHNGSDNIRLGVGANSQVLTADSAEASGVKWATIGSSLGSLENLLINGNMNIWQRGTTVTGASNVYGADRYKMIETSAAVVDVLRSTDVPSDGDSPFSFHVDVTTADAVLDAADNVSIRYHMEGPDLQPIFGENFNISFYVKSAKTGTHCVSFMNGAFDRSYIATYSVSSADTWEEKSIDVTHDTTGSWLLAEPDIGMAIGFSLMAGSTFQGTANIWQAGNLSCVSGSVNIMDNIANNFRVTRIRLTRGSNQKSFQHAGGNFAGELSLAKRYYQEVASTHCKGLASTTEVQCGADLQPGMRTSPTVGLSGVARVTDAVAADFDQSSTNISAINNSPLGGRYLLGNFTGITASVQYLFVPASATASFMTFDADF